jgi:hypothetical protein
MTIRYIEPLQRGWDRMREILFNPFDLGRWLVLAFALWLSRLLSGGGGGSTWLKDVGGRSGGSNFVHSASDGFSDLVAHAWLVPLLVMLGVFLLALIILFLWLSSRAKVVFLDDVVRNRAEIIEPWNRLGRLGNSLFWWRLGFGVVCFLAFGALAVVMVGPAALSDWNTAFRGLSIVTIVLGVVVGFLGAIAVAFVSLFLDSFVVPIMVRFDQTTTEAWRTFLPWLRSYGGHFVLYALFVLALYLGLGVVTIMLCFFTCCIIAIPLIGSYVAAVILLPLWVAYRAFTVEFLAQLDPGFDLFAVVEGGEVAESEA